MNVVDRFTRRSMLVVLLITLYTTSVGATPSELGAWLDGKVANGEVATAAGAVVTADAVTVVTAGEGVSKDSRFQIGSVTKPFTNLLLAEMVTTGEVKYDTTIGEILGEGFEPRNPALRDITLEQLATHTSGLPRLPSNLNPVGDDPYATYDVDALLEGLGAARAEQPLGHPYAYSNFGLGLLGHLLGRVDGRGYAAALRARVLEPLGLVATGIESTGAITEAFTGGQTVATWTFRDSLAAAGALWSTPGDLVAVLQLYLDDDGESGAGEKTLRHHPANDLEVVKQARQVSLTRVWHRSGPVFWHSGRTAGHGSFVGFRPDTGEGVVILVAGDADVTTYGLERLGHDPTTPEAEPDRAIDSRVLGQYQLSETFEVGVFENDGVLYAQATGQPAFELHPVGDDWYTLGAVDASIHFVSEDGEIIAAELAQGGMIQKATKIAAVADVASRQELTLDREVLSEYVGTYALAPGVIFTLRLGEERLEAQLSGQPSLPVYAKGDDVFFYKAVDAELHFERDADGEIVALVLHQGGLEQRAARTEPEP